MKTIVIRLTEVEAAMLMEVQKKERSFKDVKGLLVGLIELAYQKSSGVRGRG